MVADYVSPDYGWLQNPDGSGSGAQHNGYFTCDEVLEQVMKAMDLLDVHYLNEDHTFQYDNAMTHRKHADDSLSACHMPKYLPNPNGNGKRWSENWGVKVFQHGTDGQPVFKQMSGAWFSDSQPQDLYFPEKCKNFKCAAGSTDCCCCHILFNQPDFANVKSLLEELCEQHGCAVIFLLKFHLELNFIEMCWGYAKHVYCQSTIFMDGYCHGLSGSEAVWAVKKYWGHQCLPPELEHEINSECANTTVPQ
ncbi:hypothetical protein BS47DRAFT_1374166 [Hydnum rufescens UP504]|uniref:Uncharacterized protein n=1 Tax=Hydnum rufescens UP504 TaxID=1448309 RepID=A0A9P6DPD2_9AGAM|nr:hypothetical protein BS47DRAFT_1374166 [Hydnum rufescens UP504]